MENKVYYDNKQFNNQEEYELYILNKYLSRTYGKDNALKLLKANADDLDSLAKSLGAKNIEFFCLYFMSDTFVVKDSNVARELSEGHYELWEEANNVFVRDSIDKEVIICPRGKNLNAMPRSYRNMT